MGQNYGHRAFRILILTLCSVIVLTYTTSSVMATFDIHTIPGLSQNDTATKSGNKSLIPEGAGQVLGAVAHGVGDVGGVVLGAATKIAKSLVSQAGATVGQYIIDNAVSNLLKQYNKLSDNQKTTIKKYVCK